jgi:peptide/nickel transport system substrate-binding protein
MRALRPTYVRTAVITWFLPMLLLAGVVGQAFAQAPNNPVTIEVATISPEENPLVYEASLLMVDAWEELGFTVRAVPRPFHVHNVTTRESPWPFNVVFFTWGSRPERLDPNTFLFLPFHSSQAASGGENRIGFTNPEYDRLVDLQARTMTFEDRRDLVFRAQEILAEAAVMNVYWFRDEVNIYNRDRFTGFIEMPGEGLNNEWNPMVVEPLTADGILRIAETEEPDQMNPLAFTSTAGVMFARNVFDRLARIGPDGEPKPHMAERWDVISDTVIDIHLRPGMKWHDGEDVTAADVAFTFSYLKEWPVPFFNPWVNPIASVEATGPLSARFELNAPFAPFFAGTLGQLFIIPKHIWETLPQSAGLDHPDQWDDPRAAIGSGPFRLEHWRRGEEALLLRHEGYFMEPKIEGLLYIYYATADAVVGGLELRQVDMHRTPLDPGQLDRLAAMNHLEQIRVPSIGFSYFAFNIRTPPFDDHAVRQALMHSVDYDLLIDTLLQGKGVAGGPGKVFTPVNTAYDNPNIEVPPFDLATARRLLEEAGYRYDARGRLHYPTD